MGNARGNTYSKSHVSKSPTDKEFWNFSWHEIGIYDLPAIIDYALKTTKQEKLFYVGHSQGTTAYYVLMSTRPEYNDKVRLMVSLAPVAFMSNLKSPGLRSNVPLIKLLQVKDTLYQNYACFYTCKPNNKLNRGQTEVKY